MAITFPYDLLAGFPGWSADFKINRRQERSRSASGKTYVKDLGDPLWQATYVSKPLKPNALDAWRAKLDVLDEGLNTFKAYIISRCYPIAHPKGEWPGGVAGASARSGSFASGTYRINGVSRGINVAMSLSRPSVKYVLNNSNVWTQYAANAIAFTVGGAISIEEERTSLALQSGNFASASWVKARATATANAIAAPDGTMTATKMTEDTTAGNNHGMGQNVTVAGSSEYTWSVFMKAGERTIGIVQISAFANQVMGAFIAVNLLTGDFLPGAGQRAKVENYGNGWWRISVTTTTIASPGQLQPYVYLSNSTSHIGALTSYTGDGVSGAYVWGGQFEMGSYSTSYIPTTTAAATRAADVLTIFGGGSVSDWNLVSSVSPTVAVDLPGVTGDLIVTRATLPGDTFRSYNAVRVSGNDFSGVGTLSAIQTNRKEIRVSGFPIGFKLSTGDIIMINEGDCYRVCNDPVTFTSETTSALIEIRPHLKTGVTVGNPATVKQPWVTMSIDPDTKETAAGLDGRGQITFTATEAL